MKIRNGNIRDMKDLHHTLNNTFELRGYSGGEAYSKSWIREIISDKKRNIILVAEEGEKIAGFLIAHILAGKDIFLNDLYVYPTYRRKGIASHLMHALNKISNKLRSNFSMGLVEVKNNKMQNLFKKHNYTKGHTFYYFYKEKA